MILMNEYFSNLLCNEKQLFILTVLIKGLTAAIHLKFPIILSNMILHNTL